MKRQLTSILLFSTLLMGGASTFVSCTDHESDNAYNASISIADAVAKQLDALKLANQQLQANIDDLKSDVATNKDKIDALEAQVAANKAAIENLNGTWTEKFQKLNTQLNESIGALGPSRQAFCCRHNCRNSAAKSGRNPEIGRAHV